MTVTGFILTLAAGAVTGAGILIGLAIIGSKIEKWWASRGGRFPWEKD